jgi:hypothetical protein
MLSKKTSCTVLLLRHLGLYIACKLSPVKLLTLSVIVNFSNSAVLLKLEHVCLSGKQNLFRAD